LLAAQISPFFYPTPDASQYLSIASSLGHGRGLTLHGSPHLFFPPGYPTLISPLFLISDRPFWELSIVHWFLAMALMGGVYVWARRVAPAAAVWIAALSVATGAMWLHFRRPLSEMAFMNGCVWSVNLLDVAMRARWMSARVASSLGAAALLAATCVVRSLGIAFAGGCCVAILLAAWRGQFPWRRAVAVSLLLAVTAAAVVGGVIVREHMTAALIGGQTYLDIFKAKAATGVSGYLNGLQICIADAGRDMIPGMLKSYGSPGKWLNINLLLLYLPLFVLLAWGWTRWVRRQTDPLAWSVPLYLTVLIAYWGDSGGRYCLPLLPALWVCLWFALERLGNQRFRILAVLWGLHVAAALGYWLGVDLPWARAINRQWPLVERVVAEVRSEPGPLATDATLSDFAPLLELSLDRPVEDNFEDPKVLDKMQWLMVRMARLDQPVPPGFSLHCKLGPYCLLHRSGGP
jgi:hypothetical protein